MVFGNRRKFTLLTGASGLLGRYLMRDLLHRYIPLAVLVRPNRRTARERVDDILQPWEVLESRHLPRPVVLSGDLCQPNLGLGREDQEWIRLNCDSVIHSAASLKFYEENDEPWETNVKGVERLLGLCQQVGITTFNHISSSYVCGIRNGLVKESEFDVGQKYGNDYERSKAQAEHLVRSARFLERYTILRPSIIVGDARDGFSSTFHGFYTPLRLVVALLAYVDHEELFRENFLRMLGLQGHEGKNFVPVDWVSNAMVELLERDPPPNQAYAFVSKHPVSVDRMLQVFRRATTELGSRQQRKNSIGDMLSGSDKTVEAYKEQFGVYRSYWRNDPQFDDAMTMSVLPDLPCPILSDEVLDRLARVAIQNRFSWFAKPQKNTFTAIADQLKCPENETLPINGLNLRVAGLGGGDWTIGKRQEDLNEGRFLMTPVAHSHSDSIVHASSETLTQLIDGNLSVSDGLRTGRIVITQDDDTQPLLENFIAFCRGQLLDPAKA